MRLSKLYRFVLNFSELYDPIRFVWLSSILATPENAKKMGNQLDVYGTYIDLGVVWCMITIWKKETKTYKDRLN